MESQLSCEAAAAICKHMNDDHADAIAAYARAYGNVAQVTSAEMLALDSNAMELRVDTGDERVITRIVFDHVLTDTNDARATLIAMAREASPSA